VEQGGGSPAVDDREQPAGQAGQRPADGERPEFVPPDVVAHELGSLLVFLDRLEDTPERRLHQGSCDQVRHDHEYQDEVEVEVVAREDDGFDPDLHVGEVDTHPGDAELPARTEQPVAPAGELQFEDGLVEQFGEPERDQDEVRSGYPDREVTDDQCHERTDNYGRRQRDEYRRRQVQEDEHRRVRTQSVKQRVTQGYQAGVPHHEVETQREQCPDHQFLCQCHVEGGVQPPGAEGDEGDETDRRHAEILAGLRL